LSLVPAYGILSSVRFKARSEGGAIMTRRLMLAAVVVLAWSAWAAADDVVEEWAARYDGGDNDTSCDVVVDRDGNVYIAGETIVAGDRDDYAYLTVKYNPSGGEEWAEVYHGWEGPGLDAALAIAIDDSGNVYVTGESENGTDSDFATVKYDPQGRERWVRRYDGPAGSWDYGHDIAVNDSFNVYVTGIAATVGSSDFGTVKYDQFGTEKWAVFYAGPEGRGGTPRAIAVDADGNSYVTGYSLSHATEYDYVTVKYDWAGVEQWAAPYTLPVYGRDMAYAVAVDQDGFVYVTGASTGDSGTGFDYATVKYDPAGDEEWAARYDHASGPDYAHDVAVDGAGNVYVTGASGSTRDFATVKYNASGGEEWVRRYSSDGSHEDGARAMTLDSAGNIYVTGYWEDDGPDFCTLSYDPDGNLRWAATYAGFEGGYDHAWAIAIDEAGAVYVTGSSTSAEPGGDCVTIKYEPVASVPAVDHDGPPRVALRARTPCSGNTTLTLSLGFDASRMKAAIYDVDGRLVAPLFDGPVEAGEHLLAWSGRDRDGRRVASGVYFAAVTADGAEARIKLVVLR
jgi:uncharacterized delta-60 repeat protein